MLRIMEPAIVQGNLLDQDVDVIVNAWNRNIIPWWLLLHQGVSKAIKKKGGCKPVMELAQHGPIPLGQAVMTGPGRMSFKGIIHVAGINMFWFATEASIRKSVRSAMRIVDGQGFASVAFPIIGSGSGNRSRRKALALMSDEFKSIESKADVAIVEYRAS